MIKEVTMYCAECDGCKKTLDLMDSYYCLNDKGAVREEVQESDWSLLKSGKVYCPDCHAAVWDEDGDVLYAFDTYDSNGNGGQLLGEIE